MKILKWLGITLVTLVLVVGIGVTALVYLVDWNQQKDRIQSLVKTHTGRDLVIAGDLAPSVFPWVGMSIGGIELSNAEGFGDRPFARIDEADVKVELLPLLRRTVNVRTVRLVGLDLDLQRAADGTTNWDDLVGGTTTTTKTTEAEDGSDAEVVTEVEGNSATIAALSVGGIDVSDANVSWTDAQGGLDATLADFGLSTGAIALAEPFDLTTDFSVASESLDLAADVEGRGEVTLDLENQRYTLAGFRLDTTATGPAMPGGELVAGLGADIVAALGEQRIDVDGLLVETLGMTLNGALDVTGLDAEPQVAGSLASEEFSPKALMEALGIEAPATTDPQALTAASLSMDLAASPASAALSNVEVRLDDTTLTGEASVPSLAGAVPPLRFDLALDAIDVDRYLPPAAEGEGEVAGESPAPEAPPGDAGGDVPIALPVELLRGLDVDGTLSVGELVASGLSMRDIVVPVKAANGSVGVEGVSATLYEGMLGASAGVDVSGATPAYAVNTSLDGIQAEPLLRDLSEEDKSFLAGAGRVGADLTTTGDTVNELTAALNGTFDSAFTDGAILGINIAGQLRRARAALTGQSLSADEAVAKTDFTSLAVSGRFDDGVMSSDDLDMRSPLLRLGGAGTVDLPAEAIDYTATLLVTGTLEGQGGDDLEALKGVELNVPVQGTFAELAANPAGVILKGMTAGFAGSVRDQAEALARERADAARAEAEAALKAKEDELKERLEGVVPEDVQDQVKDGIRGLLDR